MLTNRTYDTLSKAQRWLPALDVFYLTLCGIWGLPFGPEIDKTVMAVAALIAAALEVSSVRYYRAEAMDNA